MKKNTTLQSTMFALVERWQDSGLNQKDFCKSEGLNYYKFKYWNTRKKQEIAKVKEPGASFIPLSVPAIERAFQGIELSFPNGVKLSIKENLELKEVKELINCF